jgi:choline kinase
MKTIEFEIFSMIMDDKVIKVVETLNRLGIKNELKQIRLMNRKLYIELDSPTDNEIFQLGVLVGQGLYMD